MSVHAKRLDARLLEYLQEALGALDNPELSNLTLTAVHCSRGKYHAVIYVDGSFIDTKQRGALLKALKKATPILRAHVLQVSGWFKCPQLAFEFDTQLEQAQKLDDLFARIGL
ncbi:30S ribosome-binding factor RbfA [Helicobacter suis]|uniref:Ribosome-binding factor A n=2 Tax=Helicobacter suis TaxID=104628 RepID=E7G2K8_9HELI|nr:30S ribosome-binding factor RbfA [Helicobacter suis]EFX42357.1 ribosome-binding factor A [Helicobacter suis HS5]EFX43094.1 ribosome-binding factor A [Helicobacter suis HS1]BCD44977.1 Ribosome-binding factor A RbfA [Helicobacter suis]BCD46811.1 Ribosome-binding factor A RbfA [Helicobacter suis]BCD48568.1 Ribosome-binding factor A RbfA [Helicobacter suis]